MAKHLIEKTRGRKKQSFLHGALILTLGIVVVKLIGGLFKIPLTNIITMDGMGYFGTAYTFYGPIFSLATAGFPIAISRMVSENYSKGNFNDIRQIHRVSIPIFLITGGTGFLIMFFGAPFYLNLIHNQNTIYAMWALSPAILFSCLSSTYRGYNEGLRNMYPTATSEVLEALGKLVIGLTGAYLVVKWGEHQFAASGTVFGAVVQNEAEALSATLPFAAAAAIFGVTFGSILSFLYLLIHHKRYGDGITLKQISESPRPKTKKQTARILIKMAIPIGIGAIAINVASLIDTAFLQNRAEEILRIAPERLYHIYEGLIPEHNLQNPDKIPNFLYGCYTSALTLYMLVPSITQAFGISALPNMTAAWTKGNRDEIKRSMETIIRVTALFSIPAGLGLSVMAQPISNLVYAGTPGGEITSRVLMILGIAAIFAALDTPLNSMLQAVGRVDLPVKIICVGLLIKMVATYVLAGIPEINVLGGAIGTLICYVFASVMALVFLARTTRIVPNIKSVFGKPLLASLFCAASAWGVQKLGDSFFPDYFRYVTLAALLAAVIVYVFALLFLRALRRDDLLMLPKGQKIVKVLEKRNWIR